jgi:hypothetical protein
MRTGHARGRSSFRGAASIGSRGLDGLDHGGFAQYQGKPSNQPPAFEKQESGDTRNPKAISQFRLLIDVYRANRDVGLHATGQIFQPDCLSERQRAHQGT